MSHIIVSLFSIYGTVAYIAGWKFFIANSFVDWRDMLAFLLSPITMPLSFLYLIIFH